MGLSYRGSNLWRLIHSKHLHPLFDSTAQRSAHELPLVEKQDLDACSVLGGQQMILTGQNFSADSKVIFMEKTHGKTQDWFSKITGPDGICTFFLCRFWDIVTPINILLQLSRLLTCIETQMDILLNKNSFELVFIRVIIVN